MMRFEFEIVSNGRNTIVISRLHQESLLASAVWCFSLEFSHECFSPRYLAPSLYIVTQIWMLYIPQSSR